QSPGQVSRQFWQFEVEKRHVPVHDNGVADMPGRLGGNAMSRESRLRHPTIHRRNLLQAGAIGLMGLSLSKVQALRAAPSQRRIGEAKSVIYIFLSGGLAQHDSFDPKPDSPAEIRGEFNPIQTRTPGLHICEHLPRLAARSNQWAIVRSLTH